MLSNPDEDPITSFKQDILQQTEGGLKYYTTLLPQIQRVSDTVSQRIECPFSPGNLTFYIEKRDGQWYYNYYEGGTDFTGDIFMLCEKVHGWATSPSNEAAVYEIDGLLGLNNFDHYTEEEEAFYREQQKIAEEFIDCIGYELPYSDKPPEAEAQSEREALAETENPSSEEMGKSIDPGMIEESENPILFVDGFIPATLLLQGSDEGIEYLWEPFFPRVGLGALVGSSDTGKSILCRQLALSVVFQQDTFLGHPLRSRHGRVLYVSTEDGLHEMRSLLKRTLAGRTLPEGHPDNLLFLFSTTEVHNRIQEELALGKADLVIMDCYGDLFAGRDMNDNAKVRGYLQPFHDLAVRNQCFFLLVHHVGKRTEEFAPTKHSTIGSQGFEAKMRIVLELRTDESDSTYLSVLKGNYLSKTEKRLSYELHLVQETLHFESTGQSKLRSDVTCTRERRNIRMLDWSLVFDGASELKANEIVNRLATQYGMPEGTARFKINTELVRVRYGVYCITGIGQPSSPSDVQPDIDPFPLDP